MSRRGDYERDVRALRGQADALLTAGNSPETVAREIVDRRNTLKRRYRNEDDPVIVRLMEARNLAKYGDPVGPDADRLIRRYGSWEEVIAAACRHATGFHG